MKTPLIALLLIAGCREISRPMEPLVIPPAAEVQEIAVTRWKPNRQWHTEYKIWNHQRIEAILAELRTHNTGYSSAKDRLTPQEYSIAINGKETMEAMVWVGSGWLGGVDSRHKDRDGGLVSRHRKLDPEQHKRLLLLLRQPQAE